MRLPVTPLPGWIVALDAGRQAQTYRLRFRLDGRLRLLEAGAPPAGKPFMLALDPAIGFQRQTPAMPRSRAELTVIAGDLFPFDTDACCFSASPAESGGTRCHALPQADLDTLLVDWPKPAAVLVAEATPAALLAAVTERLDRRAVADLLPVPRRLIGPAPLLAAGLLVLTLAATLGAVLVWSLLGNAHDREMRATLTRLEAEAAPITRQRQAVLHMGTALRQQTQFAQMPVAGAATLLARVLARQPNDGATTIEKIEYGHDKLVLHGLANDPQGWLIVEGAAAPKIDIETMPKLNRFTATYTLSGDKTP